MCIGKNIKKCNKIFRIRCFFYYKVKFFFGNFMLLVFYIMEVIMCYNICVLFVWVEYIVFGF